MRLLYLCNFVLLGSQVWSVLINHAGPWDPMRAAAWSCWAALSALAGLGLRYPLKMVPLLLVQLFYKSVWMIAVALPMWSAFRSMELTRIMGFGAIVDFAVIPWPYVLANYLKMRGDRWR
jgi:hypothetical protein